MRIGVHPFALDSRPDQLRNQHRLFTFFARRSAFAALMLSAQFTPAPLRRGTRSAAGFYVPPSLFFFFLPSS